MSTGAAIAFIFAIPALSVTSVALVADIASNTDPARVGVGMLGLALGLALGLLARRAVVFVQRHVRSIALSWLEMVGRLTAVAPAYLDQTRWVPHRRQTAAALVFVPSDVGRRGPPRQRR